MTMTTGEKRPNAGTVAEIIEATMEELHRGEWSAVLRTHTAAEGLLESRLRDYLRTRMQHADRPWRALKSALGITRAAQLTSVARETFLRIEAEGRR